jgi:lipopolysaccharide transport system permease protein
MASYSASIPGYLATIARYRDLIAELVARDFSARYRGSIMGALWAVISPLLIVAMFAFVFGVIFKARWGVEQVSDSDFVVIAMCGMTVHGLFVEVLGRAPTLVLGQPSYVKKVVFPLEILPITVVLGALVNAAILLAIVLAAALAIRGAIPVTVFLLPVVWVPFLLLLIGVALFISSIGVYVRDLMQFVSLVGMAALFLAPIFYPMTAVPERFRWLLWLNPLTFIVEQTRAVTLFGALPDWGGLAIYGVCALLFAWLALFWFQRIRKGFADVL